MSCVSKLCGLEGTPDDIAGGGSCRVTTYWLGMAPCSSQSLMGDPAAALTLAIRNEKSI